MLTCFRRLVDDDVCDCELDEGEEDDDDDVVVANVLDVHAEDDEDDDVADGTELVELGAAEEELTSLDVLVVPGPDDVLLLGGSEELGTNVLVSLVTGGLLLLPDDEEVVGV